MQAWSDVSSSEGALAKPFRQQHSTESRISATSTDYYHKSSELDEQPIPLSPVAPDYPENAKAQGVEGYAKLLIFIDEEGRIHQIDVLESSPPDVFGEAARNAFQAMTFAPGHKGLMPAKSRMVIKVDFKLEPEGK